MSLFISFTLLQLVLSKPERKEPQDVVVVRQETVREGPYLRTLRTVLMGLSPRNRWALVLEEFIGLGIYLYPSHSLETSASCSCSYFVADCLFLLCVRDFQISFLDSCPHFSYSEKQEGSSL